MRGECDIPYIKRRDADDLRKRRGEDAGFCQRILQGCFRSVIEYYIDRGELFCGLRPNTCEDLHYIYLPDGLKSIGQEAFDYCDELVYVYVPDSVTKIESYAFDDCPRLIISIPGALRGFEKENYLESYRIIVRN